MRSDTTITIHIFEDNRLVREALVAMLEQRRVVLAVAKEMPSVKIVVMDLIPAHEDIKVLPPRMTESLFPQLAAEAATRGREQMIEDIRMSRREREAIELIGEGLSNKEIAMRLNVSTHTAKSHVWNVMDKLALHTRLQIAAYSHEEYAAT